MSELQGENTRPGDVIEWTPQRYISILFNPADQNLRTNEGDLHTFVIYIKLLDKF